MKEKFLRLSRRYLKWSNEVFPNMVLLRFSNLSFFSQNVL